MFYLKFNAMAFSSTLRKLTFGYLMLPESRRNDCSKALECGRKQGSASAAILEKMPALPEKSRDFG